jgi:hypothetical protein
MGDAWKIESEEQSLGTVLPIRKSAQPRSHESLGRLFGWLVSYAASGGTAVELREGRFFVTQSGLKSTDLVIDHPSVSTPHALATVSVDVGFHLQDLMSNEGLFIRRRGTEDFIREVHATVLEHGDWVRFGSVDFQVALISQVGQQ